jgi:hypothetical protein
MFMGSDRRYFFAQNYKLMVIIWFCLFLRSLLRNALNKLDSTSHQPVQLHG